GGKSTLARALPMARSGEMNVIAGAAGDEFWVFGPDQDHLAPGFHPKGLPLAASLSQRCRRLAKRFANDPRLYPYFKLAHLMFQDDAAVSIGRRYGCDVVVSDCNLVLSAMGRAGNYKRGATHDGAERERSTVDDLRGVFSFLIDGRPLAPGGGGRPPAAGPRRRARRGPAARGGPPAPLDNRGPRHRRRRSGAKGPQPPLLGEVSVGQVLPGRLARAAVPAVADGPAPVAGGLL